MAERVKKHFMQDARVRCEKLSVSWMACMHAEGCDWGRAVTRRVKSLGAGEGLPGWSTSEDFAFRCGRCSFHP